MTPFGKRLEMLRRERNLKQVELANLVGIKASYVSVLERGHKGAPSKLILERIIQILELDDHERQALLRDAEISDFTFKVPKGTSSSEFELLHKLRSRLGTLSAKQVLILKTTLDI